LLVLVVGSAAAGAIYQALAARADERAHPPPGRLVDVGGRRLHALVEGQPTGKPTVILESGIATFSSNWAWVQQGLAATTRVVAVDRAGLGWSDPAPQPEDARESAEDLHRALDALGVSGPYLIAGHSYGGLVARAFTDRYRDEVVGLVLVDASHPDQWERLPVSRHGKVVALTNRLTGYLASLGVVRAFHLADGLISGLPERPAADMRANLARPRAWLVSSGVLGVWDARTRPEIDKARSLGDLPLVVLSVTDQPAYGDVLTALQAELPGLSSNGVHIVVEGATHESLLSNREHADQVVQAIRSALDAAVGRTAFRH
jgi:pimeloyl-ACP methyl ester carboxylesterase